MIDLDQIITNEEQIKSLIKLLVDKEIITQSESKTVLMG